jgi:GNAT superfamily N-acetyltransferase
LTRVARGGADRLNVLASTFGRAFVNEPMMLWPMGLVGDVATSLTRCFRYFLEEALGLGVVWEVADGNGAAVWVSPARARAWEAADPWSQARIGALTDDGGRRYDAFWEWVDSRTPDEPLWLLDSIAVAPARQGRGLGSVLIATGCRQAAAAGVPAAHLVHAPGSARRPIADARLTTDHAVVNPQGSRAAADYLTKSGRPDGCPHIYPGART